MRILSVVFLGFMLLLCGCGVAIVRPVSTTAHKTEATMASAINRIAVIEASSEVTGAETGNVAASDIMSLKLLDNGFNVVERSKVNEVIKEHELAIKEVTDTEGATKLGQLIKVDAILILAVGEITKNQLMVPAKLLGPARIETVVNIGLTARLVDVATGKVVWVGAATTQDKSLQVATERCCENLIKTMTVQTGVRKTRR